MQLWAESMNWMSQQNVEVVRQIYDAWNDGDVWRVSELFDEHTELRLNAMMGPYFGRGGSGGS